MRIQINLKVRFDTPFNIGSGALADSIVDKPLVKDAIGRPIIPGSHLKGKARHECEKIIRALYPNRWVCEAPYAEDMCKGPDFCPVCRIFGAPWRPSPLVFENLILAADNRESPRDWSSLRSVRGTIVRPGTGMSRGRGVVEDELLFSTETYAPPPAVIYRGNIRGILEDRRDVALLLAGLRSIYSLGGSGSRGLGWWHLEMNIELQDKQVNEEELLQELDKWSS